MINTSSWIESLPGLNCDKIDRRAEWEDWDAKFGVKNWQPEHADSAPAPARRQALHTSHGLLRSEFTPDQR